MIDKEKLFDFLKELDLNPKWIEHNENGFSRDIKFSTKYDTYCIEWWCNMGYISTNNRWSNFNIFRQISLNVIWPSCNKAIVFYNEKEVDGIFVVLEKLDWQK